MDWILWLAKKLLFSAAVAHSPPTHPAQAVVYNFNPRVKVRQAILLFCQVFSFPSSPLPSCKHQRERQSFYYYLTNCPQREQQYEKNKKRRSRCRPVDNGRESEVHFACQTFHPIHAVCPACVMHCHFLNRIQQNWGPNCWNEVTDRKLESGNWSWVIIAVFAKPSPEQKWGKLHTGLLPSSSSTFSCF